MEENEILKNQIGIKKESLIYFLIKNNKIVYVGQTQNGLLRVFSHLYKKEYDGYYTIKCDINKLNEIEAYYISKLNPVYNGAILPSNNKYKSISTIKKMYRINGFALNKIAKVYNMKLIYGPYYVLEQFETAFEKAKKENIIRFSKHKNYDWVLV